MRRVYEVEEKICQSKRATSTLQCLEHRFSVEGKSGEEFLSYSVPLR